VLLCVGFVPIMDPISHVLSIDEHNRRFINGSILMVLIDTVPDEGRRIHLEVVSARRGFRVLGIWKGEG
jgi:hypothetical protein